MEGPSAAYTNKHRNSGTSMWPATMSQPAEISGPV